MLSQDKEKFVNEVRCIILTRQCPTVARFIVRYPDCLLTLDPSDIERDGAIQRFEYTVEATWKAAQNTRRK